MTPSEKYFHSSAIFWNHIFFSSEGSDLAQLEFRFHGEGSQSNYRRLPDGLRRRVEKVVKGWFWRMVAGGMMIPI